MSRSDGAAHCRSLAVAERAYSTVTVLARLRG